MNRQFGVSVLTRFLTTGKTSIRNTHVPICSNCVHFIPHQTNYPYEDIPDDKNYGKCRKFGEVDYITGCIMYDFAKDCRNTVDKCGLSGSEYVEKSKN